MSSSNSAVGRVLFVDDDERWLRLLERWFSDAEYDSTFCSSSFAALTELDRCQYDVIVTDINMPLMNGIDLCREIKAKFPDIMRVVMSGNLDFTNSLEAINKGHVFRYVVKPCSHKDVKLVVYEALKKKEQTSRDSRRQKEIQASRAAHIKMMASSIGQLHEVIDHAHNGLIALVQEITIQSIEQRVSAERTSNVIKRLMPKLYFQPENGKQLEIAAVFVHMVFNYSTVLRIDSNGKLSFSEPYCDDLSMIEKAEGILDEIGFDFAAEIIGRASTFKPVDESIHLEHDDRVEVGYALVTLAHDFSVLTSEHGMTPRDAKEVMQSHASRYGKDLFEEVFEASSIAEFEIDGVDDDPHSYSYI